MNKKELIKLLNKPYEDYKDDGTGLENIKGHGYNYQDITIFCNEMEINLGLGEDCDGSDHYLVAKTWLTLTPTISGGFEFDSECDIDNAVDEDDFINKFLALINEVEYIHEQQMK